MENKTKRTRTAKNTAREIVLAPNEALVLWRRRKNWNQGDAARHLGISAFNYKLMEYGRTEVKKVPVLKLPLKDHEKCYVYRKRSKKTQEEIAQHVGCSLCWLRLQEVGTVPCGRLLAYWENNS